MTFTPGEVLHANAGSSELPAVMGKLTTRSGAQQGVVNVNTAPADVLAALLVSTNRIDTPTAQQLGKQITEARYNLDPDTRATTAWLYTQGLLNADQFKAVAPLLAARGYQYRIRCVGFGVPCGRYRVLEAVIDLSPGAPAKIAYLRDITRLGQPLKLDAEAKEN